MDDLSVADVECNMADDSGVDICIEEKVSGLYIGNSYFSSRSGLRT